MNLKSYLSPRAWESLQREKAQQLTQTNKIETVFPVEYYAFQSTYRNDPIAFVHDCFTWNTNEKPTFYQDKILGLFSEYNRIAVRGPRGLGKTALASWKILHWALCYDGLDWKSATTASVWRQLQEYLWPEIHKWAARLRWDVIGRDPYNLRTELMTLRLIGLNKARATAISSDDSETIEGLHAKFLQVIFDEAKIIPESTWDSLEGALSNAGTQGDIINVLAISSPGDPAGRFYDICTGRPGFEDWHTVHITCADAIKAGRLSQEWVNQRLRQWGRTSALYQNQVLGEFAAHDETVIIPLAHVESAHRRHDDWIDTIRNGAPKGQVTSLGLDIALGGTDNDKPVFTLEYDHTYYEQTIYKTISDDRQTMEIAGYAKSLIDRYAVDMHIDVIGMGIGIYNRLRELGVKRAIAFNASAKVPKKIKDKSKQFTFKNKRAAMWIIGGEMLDPDEGSQIAIPRGDITAELTRTKEKPLLSDGVKQVESKKDIRKRIKRSTDFADSFLQCMTGKRLNKPAKARVYVAGKGYLS